MSASVYSTWTIARGMGSKQPSLHTYKQMPQAAGIAFAMLGGGDQSSAALQGNGLVGAGLNITPTSYDFGPTCPSGLARETSSLTNTGTSDAVLDSGNMAGSLDFSGSSGLP